MTLSVTLVYTPLGAAAPAAVPRREHPVKRTLASTALIRAGCGCESAGGVGPPIRCVALRRRDRRRASRSAGGARYRWLLRAERRPLWPFHGCPNQGVVTHLVAPYSVAPSSLGASERPPSPPPLIKACRWSILRRAWRWSPDGALECIQHLFQGRTPLNAADSSKRSALVGDAPASRLPNFRETAEPSRGPLRNPPAQHDTSSVWRLARVLPCRRDAHPV